MHKTCSLFILGLELLAGVYSITEFELPNTNISEYIIMANNKDYDEETTGIMKLLNDVKADLNITNSNNMVIGSNWNSVSYNRETPVQPDITDNRKLSRLDEKCTENKDCFGKLKCSDQKCACPAGLEIYVEESYDMCYQSFKTPSNENCRYDIQCTFEGGRCDKIRFKCVCQDHADYSGGCLFKVELYGKCKFHDQCALGDCVWYPCKCSNGKCLLPPTEVAPSKDGGMSQVVFVIIGGVSVTAITCFATMVYRHFAKSSRRNRRSSSRRPISSSSHLASLEAGNIQTGAIIDTPPKYEEIVVDTSKDPEPPSYIEYLEHQRNSIQSITEPSAPIMPVRIDVVGIVNPAFQRY